MYIKSPSRRIVLSLFLFMLIFNPPLIKGVDFIKISALISMMYIFLNFYKFEKFIHKPKIKKSLVYFVFYVLYGLSVNIIWSLIRYADVEHSNLNISEGISIVTTYLLLFIPVIAVCLYTESNDMDFADIIECLLLAFSYQAILVLLAFMFPEIKNNFVRLIYSNSGNSYIAKIVQGSSTRRVYGLASNLWDHFGGSCAIVFGVCVCLFQNRQNKKLINAILILFMVYLNSRTALLTCLLLIVILILCQFRNNFSIGMLIKIIVAGIIGFVLFNIIANNISETTSAWVTDAFDSIEMFFSDNREESSLNTYFHDFVFLPDDSFQILLGQGLRPRDIIGINSDIGYIEIIWRYGLIGSSLLYWSYYNLVRNARGDNTTNNHIVVCIFIVLALFHMKINIFGVNSTTIVANIILFTLININSENKKSRYRCIQYWR